MLALILFGSLGVALLLAKRSADRFAAAKRAKGEWDDNGPKHPTEPELKYRVPSEGRLAFVSLAPTEEEDDDTPIRLGERDVPGIRDLIQRILVTLLDGSHPSHDALRAQAEAIQINDIFIAPRRAEIRLEVPASLPLASPPTFEGGIVELQVDEIPEPALAGATVDGGRLSSVMINTFRSRWPTEATVAEVRLVEPLLPQEP
jgi:hypothetical protein